MNREETAKERSAFAGKREKVVCGKISSKLNDIIRKIIEESERYQTMNDFVEEAVLDKVMEIMRSEGTEGGESLGN